MFLQPARVPMKFLIDQRKFIYPMGRDWMLNFLAKGLLKLPVYLLFYATYKFSYKVLG